MLERRESIRDHIDAESVRGDAVGLVSEICLYVFLCAVLHVERRTKGALGTKCVSTGHLCGGRKIKTMRRSKEASKAIAFVCYNVPVKIMEPILGTNAT